MKLLPRERIPIKDPRKKTKIRRAEVMVGRGEKLDHDYVWGGGRTCGYPPCSLISHNDGDCSWWQGHLINTMGYKLPFPASELSTFSLAELPVRAPDIFAEGHGKLYTIYIRNDGLDAHTIGELRNRFTECGGTDNKYPDGRPCWFTPGEGMGLTISQRLKEFPIRIHIKGL